MIDNVSGRTPATKTRKDSTMRVPTCTRIYNALRSSNRASLPAGPRAGSRALCAVPVRAFRLVDQNQRGPVREDSVTSFPCGSSVHSHTLGPHTHDSIFIAQHPRGRVLFLIVARPGERSPARAACRLPAISQAPSAMNRGSTLLNAPQKVLVVPGQRFSRSTGLSFGGRVRNPGRREDLASAANCRSLLRHSWSLSCLQARPLSTESRFGRWVSCLPSGIRSRLQEPRLRPARER
jgi:hypothetical protein